MHLIRRARALALWRGIFLAFTAAILIVVTGPAPAASAHATLLFTTPAVDGAVPNSPPRIQLVFDQKVTPGRSTLQVTSDAGLRVRLSPVTSGSNGLTLTARVLSTMPVGEYTVHWQATAQDGDAMIGEYRFAVGTTTGLTSASGTTATKGPAATTVLRWLLFLGLAVALSGAVGGSIAARRTASTPVLPPRPWLLPGPQSVSRPLWVWPCSTWARVPSSAASPESSSAHCCRARRDGSRRPRSWCSPPPPSCSPCADQYSVDLSPHR